MGDNKGDLGFLGDGDETGADDHIETITTNPVVEKPTEEPIQPTINE